MPVVTPGPNAVAEVPRVTRPTGRNPGRRPRLWLLRTVLVLPLCLLTPLAMPAYGQQAQPQYYTKPAGGITLEQAADAVRRHTGGRVLSAEPVTKGGQRGYNVRVLVDGKRVKQYYVDAEGRMSSR